MNHPIQYYCRYFLLVFFLLINTGCGYHLAGRENPTLTGMHTIAIPYFKNDTFESGLELVMTRAFADEFIESKRLNVVSLESADLILRGTIKSFREDTISYSRDDKSLEYRVFISLDVALEERKTGEILWKRRNIMHNEEYPVSADIVVSETAKTVALERIAEDLAERVHDSIIQGF